MSRPAAAQLNVGAAIALTATLPSSATLSDTQLPVTIVVSNGKQIISNNWVSVQWNLDTRVASGFRVIATLVGSTLPATSVEVGTASDIFRPLRQNGSIVLLEKSVSAANRQGESRTQIQLQVSGVALRNLADGVYRGWLKLDIQILPGSAADPLLSLRR